MVQLHILSGATAGSAYVLSEFPCLVGRGREANLRFVEPGVWDRHLQIDFAPRIGFTLTVLPEALGVVNGQPLEQALLRNGDVIEAGSIKMQFWLSDTRQGPFQTRERFIWAGVVLLCFTQIAIIYYLLR